MSFVCANAACVKAEVEQKQPALLQEKDSLQQQLQQAQQAHGNE